MTGFGKCQEKRRSTGIGADPAAPYWNALFPPAMVTPWIDFNRRSSGLNIARRLWDQREYLRRTYESVHGSNPKDWPAQHPGVVLDEVKWVAHAACLRCRWFDAHGHDMRKANARMEVLLLARGHETTDGVFPETGTTDTTTESHEIPTGSPGAGAVPRSHQYPFKDRYAHLKYQLKAGRPAHDMPTPASSGGRRLQVAPRYSQGRRQRALSSEPITPQDDS